MKPLNRLAANGERGFTLVELLVAMLLLSILGSVAAAGVIMTTRATRQGQNRNHAGDDLQKGIERISRELRVADPMRVAQPNDVVVDVYRGGKCLRIEWKLDGATVQQRTQTFNAPNGNTQDNSNACAIYTSPPTPLSDTGYTSFLRDNANGTTPLFSYFDHNGQPVTSPARWPR